ncbi:MAG: Gfo/Idh/MocA family oxidoreductase [Rhodothermales bacterium]|nr:Gfo/Idh/MocA family oxidoreductase [Rhodothermales bacterium]MBO6780487.1 Gfo/Idh/MocA family oxidoreductase [Rhodothermales bacterium]
MNEVIRTAVIGAGAMGRHHARVYREMDETDLVGVFDVDVYQAAAVATAQGVRAFGSIEELLSSGVDAVSIAVPTSRHAEVAIRAMEAGIHVLVEKPIAGSLRDATDMMDAARINDRLLMVGHIERFNPAIRTLSTKVEADEILAINVMRVGPRPPRIKDAGVIIDLAVHDIDLAFFLTGRPTDEVFAVTSAMPLEHEDCASMLLRLSGGIAVQLTANWVTPYKSREVQVVTQDRLYRADLINKTVQAFSRNALGGGYSVEDLPVLVEEPLKAELKAFTHAVRFGLPAPVSARDGIRALEVAVRATGFKHTRLQRAA